MLRASTRQMVFSKTTLKRKYQVIKMDEDESEEIKKHKRDENLLEASLKNLECPFTWGMDDFLKIDVEEEIDRDETSDAEGLLLLKLINKTVMLYVLTKNDARPAQELITYMAECDQLINHLRDEKNLFSGSTVEIIYSNTKCHVLYLLGRKDDVKILMEEIKELELIDDVDEVTLNGCKGIAWSKFHKFSPNNAIQCFKEAVYKAPNNYLWNFLLAKNMRKARREIVCGGKNLPSNKEQEYFKKAYEHSNKDIQGMVAVKSK